MKKTLAAILTIASLGLSARGADNVTSNYLGAVVYVPASFANAGDSGLTVSNAYLAIPAATIGVTSNDYTDVRAVMYAIAQTYYAAWTNTASTNRSPSTIARSSTIETVSTNNYQYILHVLKTVKLLGEATLP